LLDASSRNGAPQIPPPTMNDIRSMIDNEWHTWLSRVTEPACLEWIRTVGKTEIKMAEVQLLEELNGFETFDPYGYMYKGVSGYSVLSLKIALWALSSIYQGELYGQVVGKKYCRINTILMKLSSDLFFSY
jgi:hypothetical protein